MGSVTSRQELNWTAANRACAYHLFSGALEGTAPLYHWGARVSVYTGLPTVSIPAGWSPDSLPLAIQLVGQKLGEAELLAAAAWCEKVLAFEYHESPA